MKIKIMSLILAIVVSVMLNCSCTSKSAQEKIEDAYSKEYCQQIMNEVLSKYMIVDWDSIARQVYIPEDNSGSMLIVDGYWKCRSYGNDNMGLLRNNGMLFYDKGMFSWKGMLPYGCSDVTCRGKVTRLQGVSDVGTGRGPISCESAAAVSFISSGRC